MSNFFDKFPTISYDVQVLGNGYRQLYTNILFRLKVLNAVKANSLAYYDWQIAEKDTIEILAEKVYDNPELHWLIAYANDYSDPLFDWPRDYMTFSKYIDSKYGSQANAATQIHHRTLTILRTDLDTRTTSETTIHIDSTLYANTPSYQRDTFTLASGKTIEEVTTTAEVTAFDWEEAENEAKRSIKLIKPEYKGQIIEEFNAALTEAGGISGTPSYYRNLRDY